MSVSPDPSRPADPYSGEGRISGGGGAGEGTGGLVVDLFAGMGGWDLAARDLGLDVVGIELDDDCCATRAALGLRTLQGDVAALDPVEFAENYGLVSGLTASPPCQSFSRAGKHAGLADPRGQLVWEVWRWAEALWPQWVACEQVPDVLPIWRVIRDRLEAIPGAGYSAWAGELHAEQWGVPQTRTRAVLMARRDGRPAGPPAPTHLRYGVEADVQAPGLLPWVSMAEALGWGMTERPSVTVAAATGSGGGHGLDGGSGARATVERERERARWVDREHPM